MLPAFVLIEDRSLPLVIKTNSKAKRLTLRLHPKGEIILSTPLAYSSKQAVKFIEKSKPWLKKQLAKTYQEHSYVEGMSLPILGKQYELRHKPSTSFRVWWEEDHVLVHAPVEKFGAFVQKSLYQVANQFLQQRTTLYANHLEKSVNRISLRDTRSRWGSCSVNGNISYCWRLVFAPEQVADYVCAHEVAHLLEMNHSPQFWQIVGNLCPDYKQLRQWLRQNGKSLFQYGI